MKAIGRTSNGQKAQGSRQAMGRRSRERKERQARLERKEGSKEGSYVEGEVGHKYLAFLVSSSSSSTWSWLIVAGHGGLIWVVLGGQWMVASGCALRASNNELQLARTL